MAVKRRHVEGLSEDDWRRHQQCGYVGKNPLTYCFNEATHLLTVTTEGSEGRRPWRWTNPRCEQHIPKDRADASPPEPGMVGTEEAAAALDVDIMVLHQWRRRRVGPPWVKASNRYWYRTSDLT